MRHRFAAFAVAGAVLGSLAAVAPAEAARDLFPTCVRDCSPVPTGEVRDAVADKLDELFTCTTGGGLCLPDLD